MAGMQPDFADLSITAPRLDSPRRESIKAALESYQHTVLEHNLTNLRLIVEGIEAHPQAGEIDMRILEQDILQEGVAVFASSPRGLLDPLVRSKLIETCDLDGVSRVPEDSRQNRSSWFATIRRILEEDEQDVAAGAFPPPDLE